MTYKFEDPAYILLFFKEGKSDKQSKSDLNFGRPVFIRPSFIMDWA